VGGDHLRGHDPDRRRRGGDLARRLRCAWDADDHAAALSQLHALRRDADGYPDSDAEADCDTEGGRDRNADPDPVTDGRADGGGDAHPVQPGAGELPNAAAATDRHTEPDADTHRSRRHPDRIADSDCDAGAHNAAELHAAADVDSHAGDCFIGLRSGFVRFESPAARTSSGATVLNSNQRAKSRRLPFSGVIAERCSSMSTDGG
jgi:hypothetical protein